MRPGGWAFQYRQSALSRSRRHRDGGDRARPLRSASAIAKRSTAPPNGSSACSAASGGWGAFDADNEYYYLNYIPFADHGALLDPPTADVSARCVGFLAQLGARAPQAALEAGLDFLRREQEADGVWFGRWGTNYIYGTWSVLVALNAAGIDPARSR